MTREHRSLREDSFWQFGTKTRSNSCVLKDRDHGLPSVLLIWIRPLLQHCSGNILFRTLLDLNFAILITLGLPTRWTSLVIIFFSRSVPHSDGLCRITSFGLSLSDYLIRITSFGLSLSDYLIRIISLGLPHSDYLSRIISFELSLLDSLCRIFSVRYYSSFPEIRISPGIN